MNVSGFRRIWLVVLCAVLTPFSLDIIWSILPLASFKTAGFVYSAMCFVFYVVIVGLYSFASIKLTGSIDAPHAMLFTLVALISMRINHLIVEQSHAIELIQALALTFACLAAFSFHLLGAQKAIWAKRKSHEDK